LAEGLGPGTVAPDALDEEPHGTRPGRLHVHVRVGAVRHQHVGVRHHGRRHVGVRVEAGRDGHLRPDGGADAAQHLALGVVETFRHHGTVQFEEDAV